MPNEPHPKSPLDRLASDLVLCIADQLPSQADISRFSRVNNAIHNILSDYLLRYNVTHHSGNALITAASQYRVDLVHTLLKYGANANVKVKEYTPECCNAHRNKSTYLGPAQYKILEIGAEHEVMSWYAHYTTPLQSALFQRERWHTCFVDDNLVETILLLLEYGADANVTYAICRSYDCSPCPMEFGELHPDPRVRVLFSRWQLPLVSRGAAETNEPGPWMTPITEEEERQLQTLEPAPGIFDLSKFRVDAETRMLVLDRPFPLLDRNLQVMKWTKGRIKRDHETFVQFQTLQRRIFALQLDGASAEGTDGRTEESSRGD